MPILERRTLSLVPSICNHWSLSLPVLRNGVQRAQPCLALRDASLSYLAIDQPSKWTALVVPPKDFSWKAAGSHPVQLLGFHMAVGQNQGTILG